MTAINLNDPYAISAAGERIYQELYKHEYELLYQGKFVAVDVLARSATLGDSMSEALLKARQDHPEGVFHLIRVGHAGAFEVGTTHRHVSTDRLSGHERPS